MTGTIEAMDQKCTLLARWQAFSELQQRAFTFLAAEALATGQEFENSTGGATEALMRIGQHTRDQEKLKHETWAVVHRLQTADRSRQGLEQVASVLEMLRRLHADLVEATDSAAALPDVSGDVDGWIGAMADCVTLIDWRRRLVDALHGLEPAAMVDAGGDEELF